MMRKIFFLYFIIFAFAKGFSQDPLFTNTSQSLVYLNPSFAGSNSGIRNQFSYRNQWPNLSGTYLTYLNSFDVYLPKIKGGISLSAYHDDQLRGTFKTNVIGLGYAQHLTFFEGKFKIIPSIQISYFEKLLDVSKLNFGQIIPRSPFVYVPVTPSSKKQNIDFSSGILAN
jgi:type IX secretion system PorP/SprF family membrane protein